MTSPVAWLERRTLRRPDDRSVECARPIMQLVSDESYVEERHARERCWCQNPPGWRHHERRAAYSYGFGTFTWIAEIDGEPLRFGPDGVTGGAS